MTATHTNTNALPTSAQIKAARRTLAGFVVLAGTTGAVPVPTASVVIVAEHVVMTSALANALGQQIGIHEVIASFGLFGTVNQVGRAVFIELARAVGWSSGPFGVAAVSGIGALTAAAQTWLVGEVVILIGKKGGVLPTAKEFRGLQSQMFKEAKRILGSKGKGGGAKK